MAEIGKRVLAATQLAEHAREFSLVKHEGFREADHGLQRIPILKRGKHEHAPDVPVPVFERVSELERGKRGNGARFFGKLFVCEKGEQLFELFSHVFRVCVYLDRVAVEHYVKNGVVPAAQQKRYYRDSLRPTPAFRSLADCRHSPHTSASNSAGSCR